MRTIHKAAWVGLLAVPVLAAGLAAVGCQNTPPDLDRGPAPLRMPPPEKECDGDCYEDRLTGGQVFSMYCGSCHNARALAERPFSNYQNVAVHMRVRANLTGKEYAKLVAWLRRWHDVPPPNPPPEPSPKRLVFPQPMQELRPQQPAAEEGAKPGKPEDRPKE
jgi:hypothetical protein